MDVSIEPMTEADLDEVVAIEEASFVRPWTRRSFQEELTRNSLATYLVAKREGRVVGYGGIWVILDEAHLTTLAVAPDCRQRGIGSRLLTALMEKAVQAGSRCISLEVRPSNLAARKLYGKLLLPGGRGAQEILRRRRRADHVSRTEQQRRKLPWTGKGC